MIKTIHSFPPMAKTYPVEVADWVVIIRESWLFGLISSDHCYFRTLRRDGYFQWQNEYGHAPRFRMLAHLDQEVRAHEIKRKLCPST